MKNNIITSSQFYFSIFLSALVSLLFIEISTSYMQLIYVAVANIINFLVICFYKGKNNYVLKFILSAYFILFSVLIMNEFTAFMHSAIKSGPYWAILVIITITLFFCTRKGIEATSRASVIITFFVATFFVYIFSATILKARLGSFNYNNFDDLYPALILLFPSAVYASVDDKIKDFKKYPLIIYSIISTLVVGYFVFISIPIKKDFPLYNLVENSKLGIFKGADFLILALISIAVIFYISCAVHSISTKCNQWKNVVLLLLISSISAVCLYFKPFGEIFGMDTIHIIATVVMILAIIVNHFVSIHAEKKKFED